MAEKFIRTSLVVGAIGEFGWIAGHARESPAQTQHDCQQRPAAPTRYKYGHTHYIGL